MLIFVKYTHWPIHSDNIDNHPSWSIDKHQNTSVTLCKKTCLKILTQLKGWNFIDKIYDKKFNCPWIHNAMRLRDLKTQKENQMVTKENVKGIWLPWYHP